jgi:hypothetical protein
MTVLVEGLFFLVLSFVGIAEGCRLIIRKDPTLFYDPLGPGFYIILISVGIMMIGILHLALNYRKLPKVEKIPVDKKMRLRMMSTIGTCAIYIYIISIVGYLVATIVFFFLQFRVEGIKSWRFNLALTIVISLAYYFIFVKYCDMVFPRGIFFS